MLLTLVQGFPKSVSTLLPYEQILLVRHFSLREVRKSEIKGFGSVFLFFEFCFLFFALCALRFAFLRLFQRKRKSRPNPNAAAYINGLVVSFDDVFYD